jgi:hypothetical protein
MPRASPNPDQVTLLEEDRIGAYYARVTSTREPSRHGAAAVNEHEFEPVPGLPDAAARREARLAGHAALAVARRCSAFHVRKVGLYFAR